MTRDCISGTLQDVTDADLTSAVAQYGKVISARVVTDRETGRSQDLASSKSTKRMLKVIDSMNGMNWYGRNLTVNEARERAGPFGGPRGDRRRY